MRKDLLSYDLVCSGTARESMCSCYFAFRIPLPMTSSKNRVDDAAVNSRARQLFTMMRLFLTMVAYVTHFEGRVQTPDIGVITRFTSVWSRTTSRWTSNRQTSHPTVGILTSHPPPPGSPSPPPRSPRASSRRSLSLLAASTPPLLVTESSSSSPEPLLLLQTKKSLETGNEKETANWHKLRQRRTA